MSSILFSSVCHYCGGKSSTEDHVVPQSLLPKPQSRLPYWFRSQNVVPACKLCNGAKAHFRSDCRCELCQWAWMTALAIWVDAEPPTVCVADARRDLEKKIRQNFHRRKRAGAK